ncbi:polysaccharide deacetylase family protein [Pseudomonadota bacterium]
MTIISPKKITLSATLFCLLTLPLFCHGSQESSQEPVQESAVVLMYHHFGDDRYRSTNIKLDQFDTQLDYLQQEGFNVWPVDKILHHLDNDQPLPNKTIAITMDDAYRSVYSEAYPRLKELGWPFTVFVSTDYIDKKYSNYMTWEQMQEMEAHGASYGNHSRSHDYLIRFKEGEDQKSWRKRIKSDLQHAQQRLNKELTKVLPILAYPYGEYDLPLTEIVSELNLIAMGQQSGAIGKHSDKRFLPRFPMAEAFAEMTSFKTKINSFALPVVKAEPTEPKTEETQPRLTVTVAKSDARLKQLACYASGQGKIKIEWLSENQFTVQAVSDLPAGRSRYNCTAPSKEAGRFYWFSQPWIRPGGEN